MENLLEDEYITSLVFTLNCLHQEELRQAQQDEREREALEAAMLRLTRWSTTEGDARSSEL